MRCRRLALARGHSGEPPDREDPGLLLRFVPEFGRSLELVRAGGLFEPFPFLPTFLPAKKVGRSLFHFSPQKFSGQELELVPIGDAAPQALRGLRGGWRSPRRRLRALGPGRAGVGLHPELQNRVRLLPVAQPQTYQLAAAAPNRSVSG